MTAQPDVTTAEQAIADYGPLCGYRMDLIVRRSKLPRELLKYAKARMDLAVAEEELANVRTENTALKRQNRRLRDALYTAHREAKTGTRHRGIPPCGTASAYKRHKRMGEPVDQDCIDAMRSESLYYYHRSTLTGTGA